MFFGSEEIRKNAKGVFKKFYIRVIRTFEGKTTKRIDFFYARNENDAFKMTQIWSRYYQNNVYNYELITHKDIRLPLMDVDKIIEDFHICKGFNSLIYYDDLNDIIQ